MFNNHFNGNFQCVTPYSASRHVGQPRQTRKTWFLLRQHRRNG